MKKTLSVILSLVMILGIVFSVPFSAFAEQLRGDTTYPLYVGGVLVTDLNCDDILNDGGSAKFEVKDGENILTLTNANITGVYTDEGNSATYNIYSDSSSFPLTVQLIGENSLSGGWIAIEIYEALTLTGSGTLTAEARGTAISSLKDILFDGATVFANAGEWGLWSTGSLLFSGESYVISEGLEQAAVFENDFILNDGLSITEPAGAVICAVGSMNTVMQSDGTTAATHIKIGNTIKISTYAGLKAFANYVNSGETNLNAILTADIIADDAEWTPIGNNYSEYKGTFDGDGHKITGLTTPSDFGYYAGLFGCVGTNGVIENVGLEEGNINGDRYVGGIAGKNHKGTIQSCYNTGTINGNVYVGGIVGYNYGVVQNCYNSGTVKGNDLVGGIAGQNISNDSNKTAEIIDCYNTGAVTATDNGAWTGGIVGYNFGTIDGTAEVINCYNIGLITGTGSNAKVGGIIGYNKGYIGGKANVTDCCFDNFGFTTANAIGEKEGDTTETNVKGLTVAEMTGTDALTYMGFSDTSVWLVKADGNDDSDGKYYWFYPHLKGFDFNTSGEQETAEDITPADWNAKAEVEVSWTEPESYVCNDTELAPTVSSLTAGVTDLTAGTDYSLSFWKCTDTSREAVSEAIWPSDYKAVVSFTASGHADIEKEFTIKAVSPEITVTATESVKVGEDVTITLNYPSDAYVVSGESGKGSVTFRIDGFDCETLWGENGVAVFCLPTDASLIGEHTVEGVFNGDARKYKSNSDTATFTVVSGSYKITFKNFDGTELQSGDVEYGETPEYTGATPEKPADAQYTYTFAGWDKDIEAVTGEAAYTAVYTESLNSYTVKFVNYDGTELQSDVLDYGETPVFTGDIPTRETDDSYIYEFDKWDKDIETVTGETTYTATFKETAIIPFPDVSKDDWFFGAAQYCARNGLITGYGNGYFGPSDELKRQDFVVILARAAGADISSYTSCTLPDVDMNSYYGKAIAWAVDKGIIKGYENGKFGVGDSITREQVVTILYRYLGLPATGDESALDGFTDAGKTSAFAKEAMVWAVNNGIITGKDDTTLAPTETMSRAEIATIVMRMDMAGMFDD